MQKIDVDLNSLFNLSYNFENLKLLLTTISKNQDMFETKMRDIEKKIKENTKTIEQIQSGEIEINKQGNLDNINNFIIEQTEKPPTPQEVQEKTTEGFNINKKEEINIIDKDLKDIDFEKNLEEFNNYKANKENKLIINEIDNKILALEEKIKLLYNFIPSFPEDKTKTLNDILDEHQIHINNNNLDIKEMKDSITSMKNNLDEMSIKVNDFNIYDIFKDISDSGGDIEASKILIQALDRKTQERFKFLDEKIKGDEQETLKIKTEMTNIKNNSSFEKRSLTTMKEQIIKLQNEIDKNRKTINDKIAKSLDDLDNIKEKERKNLESMNNKIKDANNKINNLSEIIQMMKNNLEKEKDSKNKEVDEDNYIVPQKFDDSHLVNIDKFNEFKETATKKLGSLDRKYQALISEMKNDFFEQEINSIKMELNNKKPSQQEFYDLNVQVQQFSELYENIKDDNSNLQIDMKKVKDSLSFLNKKYETVILQAMNINKAQEQNEEHKNFERNNILMKFDEYVEISIFNEFIKEQTKFSEKLKKDFESYRRFYDEIIETLKKAASVQDLKNLEEYFIDLLDEYKDKSNKLFPKRSDVNKNFKSVELQIKQIYEFLSKKEEQSENWMLAKKPITGFACASCESYIGDLKENNEKVFWNQLPDREIVGTNANKIGNGFSRILNLVNINKDIKKDHLFSSSLTKADYGEYKKELAKKKNSGGGGTNEAATVENQKQYMNITLTNNNDDKKTIIRDNNITNTNFSSLPKNSLSQEEMKFGLTSTDNMNLFKQLKGKKFNKGLPPININKDDSNMKDVNLSAGDYFEDLKDIKGIKEAPKVMRIVRKKNNK